MQESVKVKHLVILIFLQQKCVVMLRPNPRSVLES